MGSWTATGRVFSCPSHAHNGGPEGFLKPPLLRAASREDGDENKDGDVQGRGETQLWMATAASQRVPRYPVGEVTLLALQRSLARFRPAKGQFSRGFRLAAGGGSMRSERELGLGLVRGGGGREKRYMEVPLRRESPRRDPDTAPNPPPSPAPLLPSAPVKQRDEKKTALSKVVIRRLPPCLTKEQLEEQLHPLPAHDYFEFCTADPSSVGGGGVPALRFGSGTLIFRVEPMPTNS
uniref:UPF3 domain-containing protein n=1 Tax=Pavo cristatus TaxID=9049 RepID=A0A8C9LE44_PAVCR